MKTRDNLSEYFEDVSRFPRMTHAEVVECANARDAGDPTARNRLVEANLRMVINIAKRFGWSGVPIEDLIQAGNKALVRVANRFDPSRGCQFSTMAHTAIRREMARAAFELGAIVHIPLYMKGTKGLPVAYLQTDTEAVISDEFEEPGEFFAGLGAGHDPGFAIIDESEDSARKLAVIEQAVSMLNPRAQAIVRARLNGETLQAIGDKLQITRERIRQIEARSMELVRAHAQMLLEAC